MRWSRQQALPARFEVWRLAPGWVLVLVLVPVSLAADSFVSGRLNTGLVLLLLGLAWAVRLGVLGRTVADASGVTTYGWPFPWTVNHLDWDEIADVVVTSSDLWVVPIDGGPPSAAGGCRQMSLVRGRRNRRLVAAREGLLGHRPPELTSRPAG